MDYCDQMASLSGVETVCKRQISGIPVRKQSFKTVLNQTHFIFSKAKSHFSSHKGWGFFSLVTGKAILGLSLSQNK